MKEAFMARSKPPVQPLHIPQRVAAPQHIAPLLYTLHDPGRLLSCSRSTVAHLIDSGQLTAVGIGRMRRVSHASIMEYIERNRKEAPR
jgi:excisionase family DNA binding protein